MKSGVIILGILTVLCSAAQSQPLIGLSRGRVETIIKEEHREFGKDQSIVSQQFNYLKYVNGQKTKTWILYFSDEDICTGTKLVCDYSEYDEVLNDLNSRYRKSGRRKWEYIHGACTFRVNLVREEWYFTLREKRLE